MDTKEEIFYDQNGYNQGEVIRQFILEFARQYPYIDVHGVPTDVIKEFLYQPHVVNSGTEKKMDLLQDYLVSQGLCEVTPWSSYGVARILSRICFVGEIIKISDVLGIEEYPALRG